MTKATDPRLIECAKAMHAEATGGNDFWDSHSDAYKQSWYDRALACILKWLEQAPSAGMMSAEIPGVESSDGADFGWEKWPIKLNGHLDQATAPQVYTAMNAQAAKEISGQ